MSEPSRAGPAGDQSRSNGSRSARRVKGWLDRLANSKKALPVLTAASFAETLIVPIPIELILIPFMALNRNRIWTTALVVTLGCVAASVVGYFIGYLFYGSAGRWAIEAMGWSAGMEQFRALFSEWGFLAIIAVGIIPIPFQVAMLAAGAAAYPLPLFILAASLARGLRYFGLAALVWWLGEDAERLFRKHSRTVGVALLIVAGLVGLWIFTNAA